ncbi:hypothetical protein ACWD6P_15615 [Streptomyces sp. NPDC002446]
MRNLMRNLISRLPKRRTHPAPTLTYRPPRPPHQPVPLPLLPRRPESLLDGDASRLVRPYLLAYEHEAAQREAAFLREMAVAS